MIEEAERLLRKHGRTGVLIDTNLLFLLVLGSVDSSQLSTIKSRNFTASDFHLLVAMFQHVDRLIVTAHVATETSNLATKLDARQRRRFLEALRTLLSNQSVERHVPIRLVVELQEFDDFGTADTAILRMRKRSPLVLTADFALAQKLETLGRPVINFNHIRGADFGLPAP